MEGLRSGPGGNPWRGRRLWILWQEIPFVSDDIIPVLLACRWYAAGIEPVSGTRLAEQWAQLCLLHAGFQGTAVWAAGPWIRRPDRPRCDAAGVSRAVHAARSAGSWGRLAMSKVNDPFRPSFCRFYGIFSFFFYQHFSCKDFRQATKQLTLWRLPEILIVQLKRFSARRLENKVDRKVNFPLR